MMHYKNMSATHAGTKKWNKIIRAGHRQHGKEHDVSTNTTTASSNENNDIYLMQVLCCVYDFVCTEFVYKKKDNAFCY